MASSRDGPAPQASTVGPLPDELWVEILSHLPSRDLGRSVCACKTFSRVAQQSWRAACFRRWPRWSAIAGTEHGALWRRQYELLGLREAETGILPNLQEIRRLQQAVTSRHRSILTEWLCEVSFDWNLESAVVFKAVAYLDHYLALHAVSALSRFQLLGLGCLRAAMGDARRPLSVTAAQQDKTLDPQRFSYISDDTYTAEEVEEHTLVVAAAVPSALKVAPNAKMFLRSFWYRATLKEAVGADEMHIYTFASFLLQLGLLDLECSGFTPSTLAASALSVALRTFGREPWPLALQQFGSYEAGELEPCRAALAAAQATLPAAQLRQVWRAQHENHGYEEHKDEWARLLVLFSAPSNLALPPAAAPPPPAVEPAADGPVPMEVQ